LTLPALISTFSRRRRGGFAVDDNLVSAE